MLWYAIANDIRTNFFNGTPIRVLFDGDSFEPPFSSTWILVPRAPETFLQHVAYGIVTTLCWVLDVGYAMFRLVLAGVVFGCILGVLMCFMTWVTVTLVRRWLFMGKLVSHVSLEGVF